MSQPRHYPLAALLLSTLLLAGCGHAVTPLAIAPVAPTAMHARTAPAAPTVSVSQTAQSEGQLAIRFSGLSAFDAQTARVGVAAIRVTLTGTALSTPVVEEATPDQIVADQGQVLFQGLPDGVVSLQLEARDAKGTVIGQTTIPSRVTNGQTTVVAATLTLGKAQE